MKGRIQAKNGYWYVVIERGNGQTPKWVKTGLKEENNKRRATALIEQVIAEYQESLQPASFVINEPSQLNTTQLASTRTASQSGTDLSVSDVIKIYLSVAQIAVKGNTYEKYRIAAEKHIIPYFDEAHVTMKQLNTLDLQAYISVKVKSGLAKSTLKDHKTVLNQAIKYAIKPLKLIENNPMIDVVLGKSNDKKINFYDVDQINALLGKIAGQGNHIEAPVILGAYYGLRRQEALGMLWNAVDFKQKTIVIRRTATKAGSKTIYADTVKSKSSYRTMPLFPDVEIYLKKLYAHQRYMQSIMKREYIKNDEICKWDDGHLVSPDYVSSRFGELVEKFGMPKLTYHELRHSTASLLVNQGYSLKEIQEWLGHADIKSTQIYSHLQYKSKINMAQTIGVNLSIPQALL